MNDSQSDEISESPYQSGNKGMIKREMMNTANPSQKYPPFAVAVESNGVIKARNDLKEEIEKKGILQETQRGLNQDINELNDEITELEKEKFKLKLAKDSMIGKGLFVSSSARKKRDTETDSRGTQYLRTDLYGENSDNQVRENIDRSLKVENNANEWLQKNKRLLSASGHSVNELSSQDDEEDKYSRDDMSSMITRKQYDPKMGPSLPQNSMIAKEGKDDLEWTFSDGISDYSKTEGLNNSSFQVSQNNESSKYNSRVKDPGPASKIHTYKEGKKKKKVKKKGKKKKKARKGVSSDSRKPKLNFYKDKTSRSGSSIPEVSNISTPKFDKKGKGKKGKSVPRRKKANYVESSMDHEGGSRATISNAYASISAVHTPNPSSRMEINIPEDKPEDITVGMIKTTKGRGRSKIRKGPEGLYQAPISLENSKSVPRTENYRN